MGFRSMPSFRNGGGGLNQVGPFYCDEVCVYRWIYAPREALVSRLRLVGLVGFWRLFPVFTIFNATLLKLILEIQGLVEKITEFNG